MTSVAPMIAATGRSGSCSDNRLAAVAAIIGTTDRHDSRLVQTLQATGWCNIIPTVAAMIARVNGLLNIQRQTHLNNRTGAIHRYATQSDNKNQYNDKRYGKQPHLMPYK